MNICEAGKLAPICFVRTAIRAHTASRQDIAQRAKVGYCPCCAQATHVSAPPSRALGEFIWLKSRGLASGKAHGPWPPRPPAACHFARSNGQLSKTKGWAAQALYSSVPEPFVRTSPTANPPQVHVTTPPPTPKPAPPAPQAEIPCGCFNPAIA